MTSLLPIPQVHVRRPVREQIREGLSSDTNSIPMVRKSKLLIVDLAGSERIDKSGLFFLLIYPKHECLLPYKMISVMYFPFLV